MGLENPILDSTNSFVKVTNLFNKAKALGYRAICGLPLGTVDNGATSTAEVGLKVIVLGGGGGGGGGPATIANGADIAEGNTTDTPFTGVEDATARTVISLLKALKNNSRLSNTFSIPFFDYEAFTYYGATNNIHVQTFYTGGSGGTLVGTLTYTYVSGGVANNDLIQTITQS